MTIASIVIQASHYGFLGALFVQDIYFPVSIFAVVLWGIAWFFKFRTGLDPDELVHLTSHVTLILLAGAVLGLALVYFLQSPRLIGTAAYSFAPDGRRVWHPWVLFFVLGVLSIVSGVYFASPTDLADLIAYEFNAVAFSALFAGGVLLLGISWLMLGRSRVGIVNRKYLVALFFLAVTPIVYDFTFSATDPVWVPWNGLVHLGVQVATWALFWLYAHAAWRNSDTAWNPTPDSRTPGETPFWNSRGGRILYFVLWAGSTHVLLYTAGWLTDLLTMDPPDDPKGGSVDTTLLVVGFVALFFILLFVVLGCAVPSIRKTLSRTIVLNGRYRPVALRNSFSEEDARTRRDTGNARVYVNRPVQK